MMLAVALALAACSSKKSASQAHGATVGMPAVASDAAVMMTPAASGAAGQSGGAMPDAGMPQPAASTSCAMPHATPGCDDSAIQQCVCQGDATCCQRQWDAICVPLVQSLRCKGDCCKPSGTQGCADSSVEQCVCALQSSCCDTSWDDFCTIIAQGKCHACSGA
jgi:hypothetical protein